MKIAIIGYGKMGKEIEKVATSRGHEIVLRSTSKEPFLPADLSETDVAIEFTHPDEVVKNIFKCFEGNTPVVTGTTGWYNRFNEVKDRCLEEEQSLFYATNFSLGVNLFFQLNKQLSRLMDPYDDYKAGIHETHHTEKKDAPSGTAITLAEDLVYESTRYKDWSDKDENESDILNVSSSRIEGVPGTHEIKWRSDIDEIEITHTAFNRKGFALGSVLAAEWVNDRHGVFTMRDMLKLE